MKYVLKNSTVEAHKWDGGAFNPGWVMEAIMTGVIYKSGDKAYLKTRLGGVTIYPGDYLVLKDDGIDVVGSIRFKRDYMASDEVAREDIYIRFDNMGEGNKVRLINGLIERYKKQRDFNISA